MTRPLRPGASYVRPDPRSQPAPARRLPAPAQREPGTPDRANPAAPLAASPLRMRRWSSRVSSRRRQHCLRAFAASTDGSAASPTAKTVAAQGPIVRDCDQREPRSPNLWRHRRVSRHRGSRVSLHLRLRLRRLRLRLRRRRRRRRRRRCRARGRRRWRARRSRAARRRSRTRDNPPRGQPRARQPADAQ